MKRNKKGRYTKVGCKKNDVSYFHVIFCYKRIICVWHCHLLCFRLRCGRHHYVRRCCFLRHGCCRHRNSHRYCHDCFRYTNCRRRSFVKASLNSLIPNGLSCCRNCCLNVLHCSCCAWRPKCRCYGLQLLWMCCAMPTKWMSYRNVLRCLCCVQRSKCRWYAVAVDARWCLSNGRMRKRSVGPLPPYVRTVCRGWSGTPVRVVRCAPSARLVSDGHWSYSLSHAHWSCLRCDD